MSKTTNSTSKLRERAKQFSILLPFMENREKNDLVNLHEKTITIIDYGFLKNEGGGAYAAFICKEDDDSFYFGGTVLTERLLQLEEDGFHNEVKIEGLPVRFEKKLSKNKRAYTNVIFYPET